MLKIESLTKTYGQHVALRDLSLTVLVGEVYGLLGPNGAGKTTTVNILCNLLKPDRGTIQIHDRPVAAVSKYLVGVAPQETLFYHYLTCEENLRFFGKLYGLSGNALKQQVRICLEAVGLADRAKNVAATLSGGMGRRLSLAIALVHQPKLLILDEPTTGLDLEARFEIWSLIRQLRQEGITILMTTHLLDEAERLCDRIGMIKAGQIIAEGSLADLRQRIPAQEIVTIQTSHEERAIDRAQSLNLPHRCYGGDLALWLPRPMELGEILSQFDGIAIDSISRQPVRLEHIYLEVMSES